MGKTFDHLRNVTTAAEYKRRQEQRKRVPFATMAFYDTAGVYRDFDDVTLADLAGLDHAVNAAREG